MQDDSRWFEESKDLFEKEVNRFKELGISLSGDAISMSDGILTLNFDIPANNRFDLQLDKPLKLTVVYPDNYPFFKPEVFANDLLLPRHQNPFAKNLCLLGRETGKWIVGQTVADFIKEQLPKILVKGKITNQDIISKDPDEQAEPLSDYYKVLNGVMVMSDFSVVSDDLTGGTFRFRLERYDKEFSFENRESYLRLMIPIWKNAHGKSIVPTDAQATTHESPWVRIDDLASHPERVNQIVNDKLNEFKHRGLSQAIAIKDGRITTILGIKFKEEVTKGQIGWGWLFAIQYSVKGKSQVIIVPGTRIGREDYRMRIPKVRELGSKTISIVGLGSLGAPSAIEFARNGVKKLKLLDFDIVEPSSTVRWPLGIHYAGMTKGQALKEFITANYPFVEVEYIVHRIGAPREMSYSNRSEKKVINDLLQESSMIYDCTGELGISNLLYYEARLQGIPYINIEATPGVWGGLIMRSLPSIDKGCWLCFRHHFADGSIEKPPQDPNADIQAVGCGDITFTGTSFELQNIMVAGVRLAISTLCSENDGYQPFDWDVAVLSLVNKETEKITLPSWKEYKIEKHPKCSYCGGK